MNQKIINLFDEYSIPSGTMSVTMSVVVIPSGTMSVTMSVVIPSGTK